MADFADSSARYIIKAKQNNSSDALASIPSDDVLVITPVNPNSSQLWYFTRTDTENYYRLHTEDKGDDIALSIYNYDGRQTLDLRFWNTSLGYGTYNVPEVTGQYWRFEKQSDGTFKISNKKTGPKTYLDIEEESSKPMLADRDSPLQRWIVSSLGSNPTPTGTTSTLTTSSTSTTMATSGPVPSHLTSTKVSGGLIAGIVVGSVVALVLVAVLIRFILRRSSTKTSEPKQIQSRDGIVLG